ncbi:unnamed protein product [Clonostachys byssicola]|uniref:SnoaL-like domain-containing protein n=1 Tax=Clonostachys byssicola TaxID=160290 RepID=A0A9N9U9E7_9HYPO|nr:unnamed protein product [Clonostachys byssicola]
MAAVSYVLPAKLSGALSDREQIADTIYRLVAAFDHADEDLLRSSLTDDVAVEIVGFPSCKGISELKESSFSRVSKLVTTHSISNIRVSLESATTARASCTSVAQHARPGKGFEQGPHRLLGGGFYICDLIKEGDLWKIKQWFAKPIWYEGDPAIAYEA